MALKTLDQATVTKAKSTLYAAVIADVLDDFGHRAQGMKPFIRPLSDDSVIFGPARTGQFMPTTSVAEGENPYEHEMALLDDLKQGDVVVFACNGPTDSIGPWGELLTTAAVARKADGCITDGLTRDIKQIRQTGFPVFHGGIGPWDSKGRGKMMTKDLPVECAGVRVVPGDYVFADADGVVVIPNAILDDVLAASFAKVEGENTVRAEILAGEKLIDVFKRHGIL